MANHRRKGQTRRPADCLSYEEAAVRAGVCTATIYRHLALGMLTRVWQEGRAYIRESELQEYMRRRERAA